MGRAVWNSISELGIVGREHSETIVKLIEHMENHDREGKIVREVKKIIIYP